MRRVVSVMSPSRIVLAAALALSVATGLPGFAKADVPLDPISEVVAKVSPAVVGIAAARPPKAEDDTGGPKTAGAAAERPTFAIGSGFIIDPAGYISTNKHVAENATALIVTTADG